MLLDFHVGSSFASPPASLIENDIFDTLPDELVLLLVKILGIQV